MQVSDQRCALPILVTGTIDEGIKKKNYKKTSLAFLTKKQQRKWKEGYPNLFNYYIMTVMTAVYCSEHIQLSTNVNIANVMLNVFNWLLFYLLFYLLNTSKMLKLLRQTAKLIEFISIGRTTKKTRMRWEAFF